MSKTLCPIAGVLPSVTVGKTGDHCGPTNVSRIAEGVEEPTSDRSSIAEHASAATMGLPEAGSNPDGRSPGSSITNAEGDSSPPAQEDDGDPHMMMCNPLYSMASLSLHGVPCLNSEAALGSASTFRTAATSSQAPGHQAVSLCSSPAGAAAYQQPSKKVQVPQLIEQKAWPPQLQPCQDRADGISRIEGAASPRQSHTGSQSQKPTAARHTPALSEGHNSWCFGALGPAAAGSCVSSPRAVPQQQPELATPSTLDQQIPESPSAQPADLQAEDADHTHADAWRISRTGTSEAAVSEALDAAPCEGSSLPDVAPRKLRPWQLKAPPVPSSCASNRPQKSSGPFFPPAARFAPAPAARTAAATVPNPALTEGLQPSEVSHYHYYSQQQQQERKSQVGFAEFSSRDGMRGDTGQQQDKHDEESSTPVTVIVKDGEQLLNLDARTAWGMCREQQQTQPEKENSCSPEQQQSDHAKLGRPDAAQRKDPAQPEASPLRERNSPDRPLRLQSLLGSPPGHLGSRHLPGPGPLAASSPGLVRAADRLLRSSMPPEPVALHASASAVHSETAGADGELSLSSPLRRSMQRVSAGQQMQAPHQASQRSSGTTQPYRSSREQRQRGDEPEALAMLRSSGILQRDGPLAASRAAAVARASAPQPLRAIPRPHPADLEAAERLRASLSSSGSSSRASAADSGRLAQQPHKPRAAPEENALRGSGGTQAPCTPRHTSRPSALPDSPLTVASSGALRILHGLFVNDPQGCHTRLQ